MSPKKKKNICQWIDMFSEWWHHHLLSMLAESVVVLNAKMKLRWERVVVPLLPAKLKAVVCSGRHCRWDMNVRTLHSYLITSRGPELSSLKWRNHCSEVGSWDLRLHRCEGNQWACSVCVNSSRRVCVLFTSPRRRHSAAQGKKKKRKQTMGNFKATVE